MKEQISFSRKFHGSGFAITHARLADRDWANTGHDLAFRQMAMAHNASAVRGLEIGMLGEKIRDLGLYGLSQQRARPLPQDFGELIVKGSWLNQLEHVIVDTAYRSFDGEVEASSTPTICRPSDSRRHQLPAIAPHKKERTVGGIRIIDASSSP